jgi:hypothetical protein
MARASEPQLAATFASPLLKLVMKIIVKWNRDLFNERMIVWPCVRVAKDVCEATRRMAAEVFGGIGETDRESLMRILDEQVTAEVQNRKVQALVEFLTNDRGHRSSE